MISTWKRALLEGVSDVFKRGQRNKRDIEAYVEKLYKMISQSNTSKSEGIIIAHYSLGNLSQSVV